MSIIFIILFIGFLIWNVILLIKCAALTYLYKYLLRVLKHTQINILNLKGCLQSVVTSPVLSKKLDSHFDAILVPITDFLDDERHSKR